MGPPAHHRADPRPDRRATPGERELTNKRAELATLEAQLAERELDLATLQAEIRAFEARYLRSTVGRLFSELDDEARKARRSERCHRSRAPRVGVTSV